LEQRPSFLEGLRQLINMLVEGYATLNRRLWVLIVPIGLDLFLWLGPRISPLRLAESLSAIVAQAPQLDPETITQWTKALHDSVGQANLVDLVSFPLMPALLPRLSAPAQPAHPAFSWSPEVFWLPLLALLAVALGLLLWSFYLVPLADLVRGSNERGPLMLRRVPRVWWRMAQFLGVALLGLAIFVLLAGMVAWFGSLLSPALGALLFYVCGALLLWVVFYLYFTPNALLVSGVKPLRAVLYSAQIVRSNLWSCLGFVLLVYIVQLGTMTVWQRLADYPWAVLLGILVNAYITAGLATAGLIFYREKIRALIAVAQGRQKKEPVV
jgi:hypothetical protein